MNVIEITKTRPGGLISSLSERFKRRRKLIFRLGCAALVLTLTAVLVVPAEGCVFWGWQESNNWRAADVSGFDEFNCPNPYELTLDWTGV